MTGVEPRTSKTGYYTCCVYYCHYSLWQVIIDYFCRCLAKCLSVSVREGTARGAKIAPSFGQTLSKLVEVNGIREKFLIECGRRHITEQSVSGCQKILGKVFQKSIHQFGAVLRASLAGRYFPYLGSSQCDQIGRFLKHWSTFQSLWEQLI